jgi:hypothetical protein
MAVTLLASGCGGSSMTATPRTPKATPPTAVAKPAAAATPHLSILSPRAGAHTGSTLTVRVATSGAPGGKAPRLRYVLDRRLTRSGSSQLTFHDLAPGRHRLEVLITPGSARTSTTFTVRAPRPVAVVAPVEAPQAAAPVQPTQTTSTTAPKSSPPPQTQTRTTAPPPQASPPESSGGIPQGGGGDGDGDNSGGPSDGDGNV